MHILQNSPSVNPLKLNPDFYPELFKSRIADCHICTDLFVVFSLIITKTDFERRFVIKTARPAPPVLVKYIFFKTVLGIFIELLYYLPAPAMLSWRQF